MERSAVRERGREVGPGDASFLLLCVKNYLLNHSPGTISLASLTPSVTFNEDVGSALDTLFLNLESFDLLLLPDHDLQFVRKRWLDGITVAMDMN